MSTDLAEIRDYEKLAFTIEEAKTVITRDYLCDLEDYEVAELPEELQKLNMSDYARFFHIQRLVLDEKENTTDKLVTVLNAAYTSNSTVVTLIKGCVTHTDYYIGIVNKEIKQITNDVTTQGEIFKGTLEGNFSGLELKMLNNRQFDNLCQEVFSYDQIASVSGIASLRKEKQDNFETYVQGIENLVDSLQGRDYSIVVIADAVRAKDLIEARVGYESLYTQLSPYLETSLSFNETESIALTQSHTNGITETIGKSISSTQNYSRTNGWSETKNHGVSNSKESGRLIGATLGSIAGIGAAILSKGALVPLVAANVGINLGSSIGSGVIGSMGENTGESHTSNSSETNSSGTTDTETESRATQNSETEGQTDSTAHGRTLQFKNENKIVKNLLEKIERGIERINECEAYGAFNCAAYVISSDPETNAIVANGYNALMRGENSFLQMSYINKWNPENRSKKVREFLKKFSHPQFFTTEGIIVNPASLENSYEMAVQLCLPKKSISGLPVIECAEFGRNVISVDNQNTGDLKIGKIYHMHHVEQEEVKLSSKELTAHTFVTGSTGAGKSNTIYQLLTEVTKQPNTSFMVIEPAKGEYKDIFGMNEKIQTDVYGTNPKLTPLLRINPFRFPETTHIYEHMDRLVEIFNVCWPMYAAMPAVLKAALENAYVSAGWDLEKSENKTGVAIYPTFASVAREVRNYLERSEYSDENKGNYKGALVTRLESLTNGINGMIFTADDLSDEELFDKNVIVDLSRIGSQETKALIMGVLVMRLQEYRSGTSVKNSPLKHVTVLEEAHNLLKRTSTEQSMEGSNLLGKSVEMLANSIAEMRTYGEAFIIADQAPGLLDMSVIRNTNTKIILRLPDYSDRELVGKAANLNKEQIEELAKLRTGVAAVYQNNWVSPVLCQFDRYDGEEIVYKKKDEHTYTDEAIPEVLDIIMGSDIRKEIDGVDSEKELIRHISISKLPDFLKVKILEYLVAEDNKLKAKQIAEIAYEFFKAEKLLNNVVDAKDVEEWQSRIVEELQPSVKDFEEQEVETLLAMLVHEHYLAYRQYEPVYLKYMEYLGEKRHLL